MAEIAVIGWGSLIWDLDNLAERIERDRGVDGWRLGAGPRLPIEFSRVSRKRQDALTLAIDPDHGTDCATAFAVSRRRRPEEALQDLALRERAPPARIGLWRRDGPGRAACADRAARIAAWAQAQGFAAAVWTDLPPNFQERIGSAFSLTTALAHLRNLPTPSLREAVRYVQNAPAETDTALRRALAATPWWRTAAAGLSKKP